jgi:repressor LexA
MDAGALPWDELEVEAGGEERVPLLGTVAAGVPFQAFALDEVLSLPAGLWSGRRVFALRVRGTSMVDEGIRDGDYLVVEPRETAQSGQTVVAEVDGGVTVKRLFLEADGTVRLQPANPEMLPLVVAAERVRIIGAVVGVFRRQGFRAPAPPAPRPPVAEGADGETLDLVLAAVGRGLREAEALGASRQDRTGAQLRELARDLRALRDCYLETAAPRLRRALLQEANELMRRLRRLAPHER